MWYTFCAKSMILIDRIVTLRSRSPCGERGLKYCSPLSVPATKTSLPVRGAWIEMDTAHASTRTVLPSLPVRGAWIEISATSGAFSVVTSLPVRGAWIEMCRARQCPAQLRRRSPCGERGLKYYYIIPLSFEFGRSPCGERGLKFPCTFALRGRIPVAPRAGSVD